MSGSNRERLERILRYLQISFQTPTRNALNIDCPFCSDDGGHCGIFCDTSEFNFTCWKCKSSGNLFTLLNEITQLSFREFQELMNSNRSLDERSPLMQIQSVIGHDDATAQEAREVGWPPKGSVSIEKLQKDSQVRSFLKVRELALDWCKEAGVRIGVIGRYTGRFIIPICYRGAVVAYQARAMSNRLYPKYLTEGDVSYFLYNLDNIDPAKPIAITEGIFDAWTIGNNAISSFSAALSDHQISLMRQINPPYWILCWDIGEDGSDAFWKGREVAQNLAGLFGSGKITYLELPPGEDPSSLGRSRMQELLASPIEV